MSLQSVFHTIFNEIVVLNGYVDNTKFFLYIMLIIKKQKNKGFGNKFLFLFYFYFYRMCFTTTTTIYLLGNAKETLKSDTFYRLFDTSNF